MSQLLFGWLNDDVVLSRKVIAFGEDFKDGYMFGELLSKFNQQLDFTNFSSKGTPAAKLNNFCLLEPSMRKIGVHFNSRIVTDIMDGKETTVKNLLYEMKTALEGIYRINKQNNNQMLYGTASDKALYVIKPTRTSYEKTVSKTFTKAIHSKVENTNAVLMEEVLKPHTSKAVNYLQTMSTADSDIYESFMNTRYREKEINRNKKEKADEFAKTVEAQNIAQWKINQRIAHDRRNLKLKVTVDAQTRKLATYTRLHSATKKDTLEGVNSFNDRLEASLLVAGSGNKHDYDDLIKTTTSVPGDATLSLMYIDRETQKRGLEASQKKMKEHHEDVTVRTLAHDQRRRKFLREYDTMQMKLSQHIFNTEVIAQLLNFSTSERAEEKEMEKVINYKKIIPDNRRNRQELMDRMAEADFLRGKDWEAVEAQREVHWEIGGARAAHEHRSAVLHTAATSAERQISTNIALQVVDKLLDVVDWAASCRQVGVFYYQLAEDPPVLTAPIPEVSTAGAPGKKGGKEKEKVNTSEGTEASPRAEPRSVSEGDVVPADIWADAVKMFMADTPMGAALQIPCPLMVTDALWPFSLSERPACAEIDWLFSKPFRGSNLLGTREKIAALTVGATTNEDGSQGAVGSVKARDLAPILASADTCEFIEALNAADIAVGLAETAEESTTEIQEASLPTELDTLYTPTWLTSVQPRHFLGEALVAARCVVDPIPAEPAEVVQTAHIPLRLALCGVSELAKQKLAAALVENIPGICSITTAALIEDAIAHHTAVTNSASAVSAPVVSDDSAVVALTDSVGFEGNSSDEAVLVENTEKTAQAEGETTENIALAVGELTEGAVENTEATDSAVEPLQQLDESVVEPTNVEAPILVPTEAELYTVLAERVHAALLSGNAVSDELYVDLIMHAVKKIPERNVGFVLVDFPNTKRQVVLLMEAFSGINYDSHRPQPGDKRSPYAPLSPAEAWSFDITKCGLDAVVHVDNGSGISTAFEQRARARTVLESGEVAFISDEQKTIQGLQAIDNETRPFLATGIDLTVADTSNTELTAFCDRVGLLGQLRIAEFGSLEEASAAKACELRDRFISPERLLPGYLPVAAESVVEDEAQMENAVKDEEKAALEAQEKALEDAVQCSAPGSRPRSAEASGDLSAVEIAAEEPQGSHPAAGDVAETQGQDGEAVDMPEGQQEEAVALDPPVPAEDPKEKYLYEMPPVIFKPNAIPSPLADALLRMWDTSEEQSSRKSNAFFTSMRDVRYQMLQRRRAAFDAVSTLLVKLDNRQELFDAFRAKFNDVPADLRFDPECVAELHLQKLELCDTLVKMSEARKASAEIYTHKVSTDAVVLLLQHRCRCECAAMVQSELQRFFVALHLLFDYAKAVRGFEMRGKVLNELEATLAVTLPAEGDGAGKKDAKGTKDAKKGKEVVGALVPFREPVAAVLVPRASMEAVPEVNGTEEAVDVKGKKAPAKDKKGGAAENLDPFAEIEARVLEEAEKWRRGVFAVTREVYEKDEALCRAVEQAVWYEAEKLILSIGNVRAMLSKNLAWLDAAEQEIGAIMRDMVNKRYIRELDAINRLMELIECSAEDALPVSEFWLVSPDSVAVDPDTIWDECRPHLPEHLQPPQLFVEISLDPAPQSGISSPKSLSSFRPTLSPESKLMLTNARRVLIGKGSRGYIPEHSGDAVDLGRSADGRSKKKKIEKRAVVNARTTKHLRHSAPTTDSTPENRADMQFRKEMAVFEAKRLIFEDKLLKRRADREKEFRALGMSAATAKLAAYNEMLLDEQQDMTDFEARYRPKRRPNSHASARKTPSSSKNRRPLSAVRAGDKAHSRPTSANAAVH